jgi:hypothetical protein
MYKTLTGLAVAAGIGLAAAPANAFPVRHAPGVQADQATVQHVWHRGVAHRRYVRPYRHRAYRPWVRTYPYAYAPGPYYYRRHYHYEPRPYVGFGVGPFGFGVW